MKEAEVTDRGSIPKIRLTVSEKLILWLRWVLMTSLVAAVGGGALFVLMFLLLDMQAEENTWQCLGWVPVLALTCSAPNLLQALAMRPLLTPSLKPANAVAKRLRLACW